MTKIVIVGGGSFAWGPLFIRDIMVLPELSGAHIVLHDIDPEALDLVYAVGVKAIDAGGSTITLEKSNNLDTALQSADFVILTITTGGLEAMRHDLEIPARYGIVQSVGDTVGPGGLARGLRNIPVVVDIARRMEAICPDAWLLNYTNPMSTLTRAISRETSIKVIGLCHEWIGVRGKLEQAFEVPADQIQATIAGINHLPWLVQLKVKGEDAMPRLQQLAADILGTRGTALGYQDDDTWSTIDRGMVKSRLLQIYGGMPVAGDRHLAEFFPFFLTEATGFGKEFGVELTDIEERYQWRADDRERLTEILTEDFDLSPFLAEDSGEAANRIIAAIITNGSYHGIMNLPNQGQVANIPLGAVVETLGIVDATGARGICAGTLPAGMHAVVSSHIANQELVVEAALIGNRSLAFQALMNDPLVCLEPNDAELMLGEMLSANRAFLPRFFNNR